jgi:cell wall-associated NlpC family hydrolase
MRTALLLSLSLLALPAAALQPAPAAADTGVLGVRTDQLQADYWIQRLPHGDQVVLTPAAIAAQNARLYAQDPSMHDLSKLGDSVPGAQVRAWIDGYRAVYDGHRPLYDETGKALDMEALRQATDASLALDAVGDSVRPRYGLVVRRALLHSVPTALRVFSSADDHDIDRFAETALFPGTPVAIVHESADHHWWFVLAPNYAAWVEKEYVAEGPRDEVLGYGDTERHIVVTGAKVRTTFTPEEPRVSDLQLDMGLRLPLLDWPPRDDVNGQNAYAAYVVRLPVRNADGSLAFAPALVPRGADVSADYLPLTQANFVRQAFKFLGERYGWAHSYGTRDCSGFASEVYRSFGVQLPRNTSAQSVSPALNRLAFDKSWDRAKRLELLKQARPGDLIYIPGHVMLVIGHDGGDTWVIHDVAGASWLDASGQRLHAHLNGVSVTPFEPMLTGRDGTFADIVTNIQRIRP